MRISDWSSDVCSSDLYRQTVLSALQDAERALSRFGQQRSALVAFAQIKSQADGAADLDRQRFAGGVISRADLNRTLRKQEQAATDLVRGKAALTLSDRKSTRLNSSH